ncbi:MAG: hypothetical protein Kow0092_06540 [Deferrisomatales bacterium]
MTRVLFEISLPAHTIDRVRVSLSPEVLPPGVEGGLEEVERSGGCESSARGGAVAWTPCWISLSCQGTPGPAFAASVRHLREVLVEAAAEGGLQLFAVPATAQVGETFLRFRDLLDVLDRLE